ncbi:MAG: 3-hydroxybutyrate dehydrogenase [Rhodospirillales bacterium]|jgi:3-hydroxybutyrate dehydrogenase|nr:3-hydroxybutyrate dehydrogenase [Rhodospirillales bacterium]
MTTDLHGKIALVTGSTSGIGLGIARILASVGVDIALNGFGDAEAIDALCEDISATNGVRVIHDGADMSKPDEIESMMKRVAGDFGTVDILVNNAGIQHVAPIESFPPEKWDAIIAINLSSSFHTTRFALEDMRKKGWGRIINMASAHALVASPHKSAYAAAKHGLAGLTKTTALETAQDGITANAICPGYVLTPLVENQIPDIAKIRGITEEQVISDVMLLNQPTKRFVKIEEIADLALFLCSDGAASMNGMCISVDGGWTAQ